MSAERPGLRARLLGPTEIAVHNRLLTSQDWSGRRARDLLLVLLASRGHQVHREQAIDLLWPEADLDAGANALYKALHALRRTLEPTLRGRGASQFIHTTGDTIAIAPDVDLLLDTDQFAELVRRGTADGGTSRNALRDALTLMRGEFIADDPYAEWLIAKREAYRGDWQRLTLQLASLDLQAGEPLRSIATLESWLAQDPYDEEAHRAVMRAYAAAGQRNAALQHVERYRELVHRELDDDLAPETLALATEIRQAPVLATPIATADPNAARYRSIPALPTPTVGREGDLEVVARLLQDPTERLLTLVGTGGIGKTRLATVVANQVRGAFPDGIVFVSLAAIRELDLLYPTIGNALDLTGNASASWRERVTAVLQSGRRLLVLDNLEQLPDIGPELAGLLEACPDLTVLATSRVPLRIRAERLYRLDPLAIPSGPLNRDALEQASASQLFLQTIARQRYQSLEAQDLGAIATICSRVDGLPLAIELAAARCLDLPPAEVLTQLDERTRIVTLRDGPADLPSRHQTLTDLVRWSYDLLDEPEQRLFRTLAVFAGGVEPDALAALGGPEAEARANLLADHHLVQWLQVDGSRRLLMLETIREVASDLLDTAGETDATRKAHLAFYASITPEAIAGISGKDQFTWISRFRRDFENARQALRTALSGSGHQVEQGLQVADCLGPCWFRFGFGKEGFDWITRLLARHGASPSEPAASAAIWGAILAEHFGDMDEFFRLRTMAQSMFPVLNDPKGMLRAASLDIYPLQNEGDWQETIAVAHDLLTRARQLDYDTIEKSALGALATSELRLDRIDEARQHFEEALALATRQDDQLAQAYFLSLLVGMALHIADYDLAVQLLDRAEAAAIATGDHEEAAWAVYHRSLIAHRTLQDDAAVFSQIDAAITAFRALNDNRMIGAAMMSRGSFQLDRGLHVAASETLQQATPILRAYGAREDQVGLVIEIGMLLAAETDPATGLQLLAAAVADQARTGMALEVDDQARVDRAIDSLRQAFTPEAFDHLWNEGEHLDLEAALDLADATLPTTVSQDQEPAA